MATAQIRPDWTIGTLNLTAGVVEFTTADSMLETAAIQAGDSIITESGLVLIIADITGQNAGTLMEPCPAGAAGAGQPLRVRFQPDGSRYNGATADLVQLLGSGNVYEFAGLDGTGGGVPVFTGSGTMDVVPSGSFGVQDPNGSLGKLAALTLAARQILQTDVAGDLKQVALAANKAIATDANGDVAPIDLGTLGRALLALATGTSAQYVRADGTLQTLGKSAVGLGNVDNTSDANKPISNATQTALTGKFDKIGGSLSGGINISSNTDSAVRFLNNSGNYGYTLFFNSGSGATDNGLQLVHSAGGLIATFLYNGNFSIPGTLSKGGGTFLIDHPLDPFNKNLRHGFVESTEYVNIYRGMVDLVDGRMTVDIDAAFNMTDGTFAALNADVMVTALQNQFGPDRVWVEAPADSGKFTIICEDTNSTATIAWMVTGRRNDAFVCSDLDPNTDSEGRFIPEFEKEDV